MLQPLSSLLFLAIVVGALNEDLSGVRDDLHFHLNARATNKDGSTPVYKDPTAAIEDRVNDLLPRMTIQEKMAQMCVLPVLRPVFLVIDITQSIQGDMNGWMNFTDPLDDTLTYNASGLVRTHVSYFRHQD